MIESTFLGFICVCVCVYRMEIQSNIRIQVNGTRVTTEKLFKRCLNCWCLQLECLVNTLKNVVSSLKRARVWHLILNFAPLRINTQYSSESHVNMCRKILYLFGIYFVAYCLAWCPWAFDDQIVTRTFVEMHGLLFVSNSFPIRIQ